MQAGLVQAGLVQAGLSLAVQAEELVSMNLQPPGVDNECGAVKFAAL